MPNLCQTGGSLRLHYSSQLLPWLPELSQQALLYVLLLPGTEPTPTRLCPPAVCSPLRSFPSSRTKTKGKNLFIVIVLGLLSSEAPFNSVSSAEVYLSVLTRLQYTSPHLNSTLLPRLNSSLHPPKESSLHRFLRGHSFTGDLPGSGIGVGGGMWRHSVCITRTEFHFPEMYLFPAKSLPFLVSSLSISILTFALTLNSQPPTLWLMPRQEHPAEARQPWGLETRSPPVTGSLPAGGL